MNYMDIFKSHWEGRFASSPLESLVDYESSLSHIAERESFSNHPLHDEILSMLELVREECMLRLACYARTRNSLDVTKGV